MDNISPHLPIHSTVGGANTAASPINRRRFCQLAAGAAWAVAVGGCSQSPTSDQPPEKVWGELGVSDGKFSKPRAIAIDAQEQLYIVDMTARIQVFDIDGTFIRSWQTPEHLHGKPTGLSISSDGNVLVPDTHYFRLLTYTPKGELLENLTIGGTLGQGPGEFGFVTDAVRDAAGNYYVSEYGEFDRVQKFTADRQFVRQWGGHGSEPSEFLRPQHMEFDDQERLWVADACNHRIQIFDTDGKLLTMWGTPGAEPGQLQYPYCLILDGKGHVYICEYGNNRIQKFTTDGKSIACWGSEGRRPGQLFNPWAMVLDSQGRLTVLDSNNHRVQRIVL